jgi:parallel beta-helix repeat protein
MGMSKALGLVLVLVFISASCLVVRLTSADPIPGPPISNAYIRSDGSVDPSTLPIHRNGNIYAFTSDVSNYTLEIQLGNIVVDGAGFTLQGNGAHWYQGITVQSQNNVTIRNLVITQFGCGIDLSSSSGNTISGNNISSFTSVNLDSSNGNQIVGNSLSTGYGVYGSGSWNQITGNTFTSGLSGPGQGVGIEVWSNNSQISNNIFIDECSIQLWPLSQNNTISNNTLTNGQSGILILRSSYNVVCGNIIKGKLSPQQPDEGGGGGGGLYLSDGCFNNVVYGNQFENDSYGVSLGARVVTFVWNNVYNNYFYGNNFLNNKENAYVAPGCPPNSWNNNNQGNYWSDYKGADNNHDGIGDTPYIINANNTDYYPVTNPLNIFSYVPTSTPSPTSTSAPTSIPTAGATPTPTSISSSPPYVAPSPSSPSLLYQPPSQMPTELPIQQTQSPSTIIIIGTSVASAVFVCAGLLIYFKKRWHANKHNIERQTE